jgi:hypothetical protein
MSNFAACLGVGLVKQLGLYFAYVEAQIGGVGGPPLSLQASYG